MTPHARRRLIVAGVLLVALNVALIVADEFLPAGFQAGPAGSSFSTEPHGTAAYAALLSANGQDVRRVTKQSAPLDPAATVMLLDSHLFLTDADQLRAFMEGGGRLVIATRSGDLAGLAEDPPRPDLDTHRLQHTIAPGMISPDTGVVIEPSSYLWLPHPTGETLAGDPAASFALAVRVGAGTLVALSDAGFLHNDSLAEGDNAAFAVALTAGRDTAFLEYPHGFTTAFGGVEILSNPVRGALVMLAGAAVVAMIAIGVRWRPPEDTTRRLAPARSRFAEAIGDQLSRTDPSALAGLAAEGRRILAARTGHRPDGDPDQLLAEGVRLDIPHPEALFTPPQSEADVIALGVAHAAVQRLAAGPAPANVPDRKEPSAAAS